MDDNGAFVDAGPHDRIELRFRVEFSDYTAFAKQVRWRPIERFYSMGVPVGVGLFGAIVATAVWSGIEAAVPAVGRDNGSLFVIFCAFAVYLLMLFVVAPAYLRGYYEGQPIGMADSDFVADARGVTATIGALTTSFPWSGLVAWRETKNHVFLMHSRIGGLIVPKRAASPGQFERLVSLIRSHASVAAN